jgi:hypothetical protein
MLKPLMVSLLSLGSGGGELCAPESPLGCMGAGYSTIATLEACFGSGIPVLAAGDFINISVIVVRGDMSCDLFDSNIEIRANGEIIFQATDFVINEMEISGSLQAELPSTLEPGSQIAIEVALDGVVGDGSPAPFCTLFAGTSLILRTVTCRCDVTRDGVIDVLDLVSLIEAFGSDQGWPVGDFCTRDINRDGFVDEFDLKEFFGSPDSTGEFGPCWPGPGCPSLELDEHASR